MEDIEKLQGVSVQNLLDLFKGPSSVWESKVALRKADTALRALSAVGRIKATERAKDSMKLVVLKSIVSDPKEFKKYVAVSMPHLNPMKQITGK